MAQHHGVPAGYVDAEVVGRLLFGVRVIVAVVVASVALGFLVTPGGRAQAEPVNPVVTVGREVVTGMASFGRGLVDLAEAALTDPRES